MPRKITGGIGIAIELGSLSLLLGYCGYVIFIIGFVRSLEKSIVDFVSAGEAVIKIPLKNKGIVFAGGLDSLPG